MKDNKSKVHPGQIQNSESGVKLPELTSPNHQGVTKLHDFHDADGKLLENQHDE